MLRWRRASFALAAGSSDPALRNCEVWGVSLLDGVGISIGFEVRRTGFLKQSPRSRGLRYTA